MMEIKTPLLTPLKGRVKDRIAFLFEEVSAAPLVVFRIAFGLMMFVSLVRFALNGWIDALYVQPKFFFTYYGFEWIRPLDATGMYLVFGLMMLASLFIAAGFLYRFSAITFFLFFTYVELIDKANYLNHYYFISVISFLLCLLPGVGNKLAGFHRPEGFIKKLFSPFGSEKPARFAPEHETSTFTVPRWVILTIQLQMAIVYFFAGVAKINYDWLLQAMPLKVWLPTKTDLPLIGFLLAKPLMAYVFCWCGMLFDVTIAFFLFNRKTVWYAYAAVVVFHVLTAILFPAIGVFPFVMIVCATVFLPASFHERVLAWERGTGDEGRGITAASPLSSNLSIFQFLIPAILVIHFSIQVILPLRSNLYSGNLFYHEQGYRFSWRVMLMEKAGLVFFHVKNEKGILVEVNNRDFLTMQQEKQMSTQPDMVLQFAQHLKNHFHSNEVYAEAYVSVNGKGSRLFLDPNMNLANVEDGFVDKKWVLAQAEQR